MSSEVIHVSEERLKLILAEFKLELVREFANYATKEALAVLNAQLDMTQKNVADLQLWQAGQMASSDDRKEFSAWKLTVVGLCVALLGTVATLVWLAHG